MGTDEAVSVERPATFGDVLAIKEFRALFVAQILSVAGDQLARVAVAVIVFSRTGSTLLTSVSYAVSYLPWLVGGPLLSGLADRKPKREVMVVCDLIRVVLVALLALPRLPIGVMVGLVALVALGEPPFDSARSALIPDVVGEGNRYAAASTLQNTTNQLAVVVGFAIGGGLVAAVGARPSLVVDAVTFAVSALVTVRFVTHRPAAMESTETVFADLRAGARTVFLDPKLRWLVVTSWLILGVTVSTEAAAVPYATIHGAGSATAGLLIASLPLGMMSGALVLGRLCTPRTSERLMMPLALAAPIILAISGANPRPLLAGLLWFVTGCAAAMTVSANRVFMVSVPRAMRGRAFGIAVTGITAAQGIFSLAVGWVARYVSVGTAIADLALPTFAVLVVFSVTSSTYRSAPNTPIHDEKTAMTEDNRMPAPPRHPERRAWLLTVALIAIAAVVAPMLHGHHAYADTHVARWWIFVVFVVGQAYPLEFEIHGKTFQVVLETIPLVLGLVFLSPLELVLLRVVAGLIADVVIDRLSPVKALFNAANFGVATLASIGVFVALSTQGDGLHPAVWPAVFAAVITSEVIGGTLVGVVLWLTGGQGQVSQTGRVIAFGAGVSIVMTFLAVFAAAAIAYDVSTAWAVSVFIFLAITAAQTYHRLVERAAALDRLWLVARELGPIASDPGDLAPALIQLRQVIRARNLELAVGSDQGLVTIVTVSAENAGEDRLTIEHHDDPEALAKAPRERKIPGRRLDCAASTNDRDHAAIGSPVCPSAHSRTRHGCVVGTQRCGSEVDIRSDRLPTTAGCS